MKIEVLFPEICNLFGDAGNVLFLEKTLPDAEFLRTPLSGTPRFPGEPVDFVYMGGMTEQSQALVIDCLRPYTEAIRRKIAVGTVFLFTGNALEVLGEDIAFEDGSTLRGLGIFPLHARCNRNARRNSAFLGSFENMKIMGFRSQFSASTLENHAATGLFRVEKGAAQGAGSAFEGVRLNHFFGTYLLGPLLVMNPPFTRYLLELLGAGDTPLAFERAVIDAYAARLESFCAVDFLAEPMPSDNRLPSPFRHKKEHQP